MPCTSSGGGDIAVSDRPSVLFVCVHNAGRSQMAQGWLRHLAGNRVEVRSAGSEPADQLNPVAVAAMPIGAVTVPRVRAEASVISMEDSALPLPAPAR